MKGPRPEEVLAANQRAARAFLEATGRKRLLLVLRRAQKDLEGRLASTLSGEESFTTTRLRASLAQVKLVTLHVERGMKSVLLGQADPASKLAAKNAASYLRSADKAYRGVGSTPLAISEAKLFDKAAVGVRASILSRLGLSADGGLPGGAPHPARWGILRRYGEETIGHFEDEFQRGVLTGATVKEMRDRITEKSPFLQKAPAHWAERIVRTESLGVYNKASLDAGHATHEQLGDCVKILCGVFDERTASDSYADHGEIRRMSEPFESWTGLYQHPPSRPNDRAVVVIHRTSWEIPDHLHWKSDGEVLAAWRREGRKGSPPPRPKMTTVPLKEFGKESPAPKRA